jgi:branched-chain amino acid transport system permease protein
MTGYVVQGLYTTLVLGSTYAVMATGMTLIWGGLRFLNLAYGGLFSVGAFAAYFAVLAGVPPVVGLLVGFAATAALGGLMHLGVFRPLLKRADSENATLVAGLGLAMIIEAVLILLFTPRERSYPDLVSGQIMLPGGVGATAVGGLIIVSAFVVLVLLALFLGRTRFGVGIRALGNDRVAAELLGIDTGRLTLVVMVLGSGLAGLSGVLLSSFYFVSIGAGFTVLLKALIVTVAGGLGNIRGTLIAAYLVSFVETVVSLWLGAQWSLPIVFALMLVLLATRPRGIAGKVSFEGGM